MQRTKLILTIINFLQFFVWGAWMMTLGHYGFVEKGWSGAEFGLVFSTMGIASLVMPTLFGILADKYGAHYVYAALHVSFGITMFFLPGLDAPADFFWVLLLAMCFYMPTLGLNNSLGFLAIKNTGGDPVKDFPPIRVWGTVGFIVAMWVTNYCTKDWGLGYSIAVSFKIAGVGALLLAMLSVVTLDGIVKRSKTAESSASTSDSAPSTWVDRLGLRAFALFRDRRMALFFIFSLLLGGALQLTNAYGDSFLQDTSVFPRGGMINDFSTIILSISQISETLFILAIPYFMGRFGIRRVMLLSMAAWVLRFGLFGVASDSALGFGFIIASCIVYGMAFDFFNISGALFVDKNTSASIRSSAQGVFMLMTNGIGAVLGNILAGWVITMWFEDPTTGTKDWSGIWLSFAAYSLVVMVLFAIFFREPASSEQPQ